MAVMSTFCLNVSRGGYDEGEREKRKAAVPLKYPQIYEKASGFPSLSNARARLRLFCMYIKKKKELRHEQNCDNAPDASVLRPLHVINF